MLSSPVALQAVLNQPLLSLNLTDAATVAELMFARSGTGTYDSPGYFAEFADGEPRFGVDGLLVEAESTNRAWIKDGKNSTLTSGQSDPLGGTDAYLVTENTSTAYHSVDSNVLTVGGLELQAIALKAGTCTRAYLFLDSHRAGGDYTQVSVDLTNGEILSTSGENLLAYSVSDIGDGWYLIRAVIDVPVAADRALVRVGMLPNDATHEGATDVEIYTGTRRTMYAYGMMNSMNIDAWSIIPTTSAAVTRYADEAHWPASWLSAVPTDAGKIVIRAKTAQFHDGSTDVQTLFGLTNGTESITVQKNASGNLTLTGSGFTTSPSIDAGAVGAGEWITVTVVWKGSDGWTLNGVTGAGDTWSTGLSDGTLGSDSSDANQWNGQIKKVEIFDGFTNSFGVLLGGGENMAALATANAALLSYLSYYGVETGSKPRVLSKTGAKALDKANAGRWADADTNPSTLLSTYSEWVDLASGKRVNKIIFSAGENDGPTNFGFDAKITRDLNAIFSDLHSRYPNAEKYAIIPPRNLSNSHWDGSSKDTAAQDRRESFWQLFEDLPYVKRGPEFYDLVGSAALPTENAETLAQRVAHVMSGGSAGASIVSATTSSGSDEIEVTLSHGDGFDFTPTTGIQGFVFYSDSTRINVSSAVRVDALTIKLTLAAVPSGTTNTLYYIWRQNYGVTDVTQTVHDDSPLAMPLLSAQVNVEGVSSYSILDVSIDNINPSTSDVITYTIDATDAEDDGSVTIAVEGDLDDSYFSSTFISALQTAADAATGVSFDGVDTLTFSTGFAGLSWSRTLSGSPSDGDVHAVRLTSVANMKVRTPIATAVCGTPTVPSVPSNLYGVSFSGAEFGGYSFYDTDGSKLDFYIDTGKFNIIRLPMKWSRLQPTLGGALDIVGDGSGDAEKYKFMVDYITAAGLYCFVDPHDYGGYSSIRLGKDGGATCEQFVDFWEKLADYLGANDKIIYGIMNEPVGVDLDYWWGCNQAVTNALRAKGYNNLVFVPGTDWSSARSWVSNGNAAKAELFTDPANNYVFEVHQYLDSNNSGSSSECAIDAGSRIDAITSWASTNGYKLFLGEFSGGWWGDGENLQCQTELPAMMSTMMTNSSVWFGWTAWGGGPWWGNYIFALEYPAGTKTSLMTYYEGISNVTSDPAFITVWRTTTAGESITLPLAEHTGYPHNFTVDWGDGSSSEITSYDDPDRVHTYAVAGDYTVTIRGDTPWWDFGLVTASRNNLVDIVQWGANKWRGGLQLDFCVNLTWITAKDTPDLSECTGHFAYYNCHSLAGGVSIPDYNPGPAMSISFNRCYPFNQDISDWDISQVREVYECFRDCRSFKQNLGSWDFRSCENFTRFLDGADINETGSTDNYDALLQAIATTNSMTNRSFSGGSSKYSDAGEIYRNILLGRGWTITDGGHI